MSEQPLVEQLYRALLVSPCRCVERPKPVTCPRCAAIARYRLELGVQPETLPVG